MTCLPLRAKFRVKVRCPDKACMNGTFELEKDAVAELPFTLELDELRVPNKQISELRIQITSTTTLGTQIRSNKWRIEYFDARKHYLFYMGEYIPNSSMGVRLFLRGKLNGQLPELESRHMYSLSLRPSGGVKNVRHAHQPIAQIYVDNEKRAGWTTDGFRMKLSPEGIRYLRQNSKATMVLELHNTALDECCVCLELVNSRGHVPRKLKHCAHFFHMECITEWLASGHGESCPTCRGAVTADTTRQQRRGHFTFLQALNPLHRHRAAATALPTLAAHAPAGPASNALPSARRRRKRDDGDIFAAPIMRRIFRAKIERPILQNGKEGPRFVYEFDISSPKMSQKLVTAQSMKTLNTQTMLEILLAQRDIVEMDPEDIDPRLGLRRRMEAAAAPMPPMPPIDIPIEGSSTTSSSESGTGTGTVHEANENMSELGMDEAFIDAMDGFVDSDDANELSEINSVISDMEGADNAAWMSDDELERMANFMMSNDLIVLHGMSPSKQRMIIRLVNEMTETIRDEAERKEREEITKQRQNADSDADLLNQYMQGDQSALDRLSDIRLKNKVLKMAATLDTEALHEELRVAIALSKSVTPHQNGSPSKYSPSRRFEHQEAPFSPSAGRMSPNQQKYREWQLIEQHRRKSSLPIKSYEEWKAEKERKLKSPETYGPKPPRPEVRPGATHDARWSRHPAAEHAHLPRTHGQIDQSIENRQCAAGDTCSSPPIADLLNELRTTGTIKDVHKLDNEYLEQIMDTIKKEYEEKSVHLKKKKSRKMRIMHASSSTDSITTSEVNNSNRVPHQNQLQSHAELRKTHEAQPVHVQQPRNRVEIPQGWGPDEYYIYLEKYGYPPPAIQSSAIMTRK